jgi:hypothetical protein
MLETPGVSKVFNAIFLKIRTYCDCLLTSNESEKRFHFQRTSLI